MTSKRRPDAAPHLTPPRFVSPAGAPGVDLDDDDQRGLIMRQFWARFAHLVSAKGLDPEDCLQEIYRGFLTRNRGRRPFDPQLSSLSNYAYIVIRSVTLNFLDHHRRADVRLGQVGLEQDACMGALIPMWVEPPVPELEDVALGRTDSTPPELRQWL